MPKKKLQKLFPSAETIQAHPSLKILGPLVSNPNLFHLNRRSVARAFFIGIFCAFIPMPFQMVLAAFIAFFANANLPISVGLVWLSNPVTIPPIFYATYQFGAYLLDIPSSNVEIQLSLEWALNELNDIWLPLYFGSLTAGLILAIAGYIGIRILWRIHVVSHWRKRQHERALRSQQASQSEAGDLNKKG